MLYVLHGRFYGDKDKAREHILRSKGFSKKRIDMMPVEEQVRYAILDQKSLKESRELGRFIDKLKDGNEEDVLMYNNIMAALDYTTKQARLLSIDLRDDVDAGFLDKADVEDLTIQAETPKGFIAKADLQDKELSVEKQLGNLNLKASYNPEKQSGFLGLQNAF